MNFFRATQETGKATKKDWNKSHWFALERTIIVSEIGRTISLIDYFLHLAEDDWVPFYEPTEPTPSSCVACEKEVVHTC